MARPAEPNPIRDISFKKVKCPVCNCNFDSWFCPTCGLPKFNSKYLYETSRKMIYGGQYHFRPESRYFENFQLCSKCYTTNPYGAKYCRNCGENMQQHAADKNGHGWIDLGLSVLWSTENMVDFYRWMDTENHLHWDPRESYSNYKGNGKDTATYIWGMEWRLPTKEEFEELINKCKWEKVLVEETSKPALKITGPNGNHILFPMTGRVDLDVPGKINNEDEYCCLWTSTKDLEKEAKAYAFWFRRQGELKLKEFLSLQEIPIHKRHLQVKKSSYLSTEEWIKTSFKKAEDRIELLSLKIGNLHSIRPVADKKWQGHI